MGRVSVEKRKTVSRVRGEGERDEQRDDSPFYRGWGAVPAPAHTKATQPQVPASEEIGFKPTRGEKSADKCELVRSYDHLRFRMFQESWSILFAFSALLERQNSFVYSVSAP